MGKLIVIEGLDGCGKSTQLELLRKKLTDALFITFPRYDTDSGRMISAYLSGAFGEEDPVRSAYSASIMYATDRYVGFRTEWHRNYEAGQTVISARYVSSNAIYQMTKLGREERSGYLEWLCDLEYNKLGLPRPCLTIFLDMPVGVSQKLLSARYNGDEGKKDIHERDKAFLAACRDSALYTAERFGWSVVPCSDGDEPLPPETINEKLTELIIDKTGGK